MTKKKKKKKKKYSKGLKNLNKNTVNVLKISTKCLKNLNKNTVNVLKISTHFFFFLFLQNAYKCSCSPRAYVVDVVPEHLDMRRLMTKTTK